MIKWLIKISIIKCSFGHEIEGAGRPQGAPRAGPRRAPALCPLVFGGKGVLPREAPASAFLVLAQGGRAQGAGVCPPAGRRAPRAGRKAGWPGWDRH